MPKILETRTGKTTMTEYEPPTEVKQRETVEWLEENKPDLAWCDLSQDTEAIKDHVGGIAEEYDTFFVGVEGGEYVEVWGMVNIVPYHSKTVERIV